MKLIKNGHVLTMEGKEYANGYVLIDGTRILAVGNIENLSYSIVDCEEIIDAQCGYIMPGLIDAHNHLGMWEDGLGFEGADGNEDTDPITPQLRAIDAINPFDHNFKEALEVGITTVVTGPGSANVIGGQFAAIKTHGNRVDDMLIKAPIAIKAALGENPKTIYHGKNQAPSTRMATAALLREALLKASEYKAQVDLYNEEREENDKPDLDFKSQALLGVLNKEIPLKIHVHRADDIFTAIRIAKEFNINITLDHCTEAHLIGEQLLREGYPILLGPSLCERSKPELKNLTFKTAGILEALGIQPAIITDHPVIPVQYLSLCAALAVKDGMSEQAALSAITINAARNTGIDGRVGSIKVGKDADIAVFDKHPLNIMARAVYVFVNGQRVK